MAETSTSALAERITQAISQPAADLVLRQSVDALIEALSRDIAPGEEEGTLAPALRTCERLHGQARSALAIPLSRAIRDAAHRTDVVALRRWSSTACGVLLVDTGDTVGAIQHFIEALRMAALEENRHRMSGLWQNMGTALSAAGSDEMAMRCYERALALLEKDEDPIYQRFLAYMNLAGSCSKLHRVEEGIAYGERSLHELTEEIRAVDRFNGVAAHRNLVRLYVAAGRLGEARAHVEAASRYAEGKNLRVRVAADIAKAIYESAMGQHDIALTRIDNAVTLGRSAANALGDALVCAIRCEEAAGHPARALVRLQELSEHVYRSSVAAAREHIRLAGLAEAHGEALHSELERQRSRLVAQLDTPRQPEGWKALRRLAIQATMPADGDGRHGERVGALTRVLAEAVGVETLRAREIGRAAEVHDIGMSAVPREILSKPGSLNESELQLVRRHVAAGSEMLAEGDHPRMLLAQEIARFHHARFDGAGYPAGASGESIPLGARLCAVADAYDMMICGCGGRPRKSMAEALAELRRNAGGQFDPGLVERFEEVIRSEAEGMGMDLSSGNGMEDFHELVLALKEDRGFA